MSKSGKIAVGIAVGVMCVGTYYYIFGRGLRNMSRFEEWQIKHGYKKLPQ